MNVVLNSSLSVSVRITAIEGVEIGSEKSKYTLLILGGDQEVTDLLFSLNIGSEFVDITIEGED